MLFGLDMLKRYQANIDLMKNALVINGREIPFLAEHELPKNAFTNPDAVPSEPSTNTKEADSTKVEKPAASATSAAPTSQTSQADSTWPKESIAILTNLGIPNDLAIKLLNASNGNTDLAANIYFQEV